MNDKSFFDEMVERLKKEQSELGAEERKLLNIAKARQEKIDYFSKELKLVEEEYRKTKNTLPIHTGSKTAHEQNLKDREEKLKSLEHAIDTTKNLLDREKGDQEFYLSEKLSAGSHAEAVKLDVAGAKFERSIYSATKEEKIKSELHKYQQPRYMEKVRPYVEETSASLTRRGEAAEARYLQAAKEMQRLASDDALRPEITKEGEVMLGPSKGEFEFKKQQSVFEESIEERGLIKAAEAEKRRRGEDISSLIGFTRDFGERVTREEGARLQAREKIASGKTGSLAQEQINMDKLTKQIDSLVNTIIKLDTAAGDHTEEIELNAKELKNLSKDYKDQQALIRTMREQGGGGGIMGNLGVAFGTFSDIALVGARTTREIGVNQTLQDIQNRTAMAAISNMEFKDHLAALRGDMGAFRRMEFGTYAAAADKALTLGRITSGTVLTEGLANAGKAAEVGLNTAANVESLLRLPSATAADAAGKMAAYGGQSAVNLADFARGISKFQTVAQAFRAYKEMEDTTFEVMDYTTGQYRDFTVNAALATRGGGRIRNQAFDTLNNAQFRENLARLGMSQEQMQQVTQQGISAMGADFRSGTMMQRAAELQRTGVMNAGDYISSMATLNQIGGAAQMEDILKNAVAAGMDTSKNIQQMVGAITDLSTQGAIRGLQTAEAAATMIGVGVQTNEAQGLPAAMRARMAANAAANISERMKDTALTWWNVGEMRDLRELFPEAGITHLTRIQSMTSEELMSLNDPKNVKKMGLGSLLLDRETGEVRRDVLNKIRGISGGALIGSQLGLRGIGLQDKVQKLLTTPGLDIDKEYDRALRENDREILDILEPYRNLVSEYAATGATEAQVRAMILGQKPKKPKEEATREAVERVIDQEQLNIDTRIQDDQKNILQRAARSKTSWEEFKKVSPEVVEKLTKITGGEEEARKAYTFMGATFGPQIGTEVSFEDVFSKIAGAGKKVDFKSDKLIEVLQKDMDWGEFQKEHSKSSVEFEKAIKEKYGMDAKPEEKYEELRKKSKEFLVGKGGPTGPVRDVENVIAQEWKAMEKVIQNGNDIMDKVYGGMKNFNDKLSALNKTFDPKMYQERAMSAAGELDIKVGEGFKAGVVSFQEAVNKFRESVGLKETKFQSGPGAPADANAFKNLKGGRVHIPDLTIPDFTTTTKEK